MLYIIRKASCQTPVIIHQSRKLYTPFPPLTTDRKTVRTGQWDHIRCT